MVSNLVVQFLGSIGAAISAGLVKIIMELNGSENMATAE
jgi:hypothetical protein